MLIDCMRRPKVLIVEDEWIVSEELKELLIRNQYEVIGQAESAKEAMRLCAENPPDIALLDINIKGDKDGIELARDITDSHSVALIFITAFYDEYFINRAKKVSPAAYIVKPFDERNLIVSIQLAFEKIAEQETSEELDSVDSYMLDDRIFVKDKHRYVKLEVNDISCIMASGSYIFIHTVVNKTFTLALNLSQFSDRLSHSDLVRVHRSYIVNIRHIEELETSQLKVTGMTVGISQTYRDELLSKLRLI